MQQKTLNIPRKAALWMASFTLVAAGSWYLFFIPGPASPIPYLKGETRWPDSLLRNSDQESLLAQLILYTPLPDSQDLADALPAGEILTTNPGGLYIKVLPLKRYLALRDSLNEIMTIPPFFFTDNPVLHNNQFSDAEPFIAPGTLAAMPGKDHYSQINQLSIKQSVALGFSVNASIELNASWRDSLEQHRLLRNFAQEKIVAGVRGLSDFDLSIADTLQPMVKILQDLNRLHTRGLGLMVFETRINGTDSIADLREGFLSRYLLEKLGYQGLIAGVVSQEAPLEYWVKAGADLFISPVPPSRLLPKMKRLIGQGDWRRPALRRSLRKVFLAKQWINSNASGQGQSDFRQLKSKVSIQQRDVDANADVEEELLKHFQDRSWGQLNYRFRENALLVANDYQQRIPWKNLEGMNFILWSPGGKSYPFFERIAHRYASCQSLKGRNADLLLSGIRDTIRTAVIALLDPQHANPLTDTLLAKALQQVNEKCVLAAVNFGISKLHTLPGLDFPVIQLFELHNDTESLAAQLFFGGVGASGKWPAYHLNGPEVQSIRSIRLGFAPPERIAVAPEKLVGIEAIARTAIERRLIPGCQILVAKEGKVIYSKSFGRASPGNGEKAVHLNSLYDIASLTKIAATTLAVMRLYEERKIGLNDPLKKHLSWLKGKPVGEILLRDLLTHQSGLPAGLPIGRYIRSGNYRRKRCDDCFCRRKEPGYNIQIAGKLFFHQRCKKELVEKTAALIPSKRRKYRYSDINFWLLQQVVEAKTGQRLDLYLEESFYRPLGLRHTLFNPIRNFSQEAIVPAEGEKGWRRQVVRGFVHDPSAALLGGVAGHAGLFSTAEDLAVIMQLLLDKGSYGGRQWFAPSTVNLFTRQTFGNHRSLGFDHPSRENRNARARILPMSVFGHSGFTGTCAWADPENKLIFIFLSNRTFSVQGSRMFNRQNIRGRIHQVAYDALGSFSPKLPDLE